MKDLYRKTLLAFGATIGIVILILLSPVLIILLPYFIIKSKQSEKEYQHFLAENNGKKFFCYTSRKKSKELIEKSVLPLLDKDIHVILLNGKNPISDFPSKYISTMLYRIKNIGFPNIMKIVNQKVTDISLKKEFHNNKYNQTGIIKFGEIIKSGFNLIDNK